MTGVFTTLKQQLETTKIEEVKELDYVIVLDSPDMPLIPSWPNKKLTLVLTGFLGIGLGLLIGILKEFFKSINRREKNELLKMRSLFLDSLLLMNPFKSRK